MSILIHTETDHGFFAYDVDGEQTAAAGDDITDLKL